MDKILGIAAFGILGALSRYGLDQLLNRFQQTQGLSTLLVNIVGSFAAGAIIALAGRQVLTTQWQTWLLVGFCGSFTTFSAYSIHSLNLINKAEPLWAFSFVILNPVLALGSAYLGIFIFSKLL